MVVGTQFVFCARGLAIGKQKNMNVSKENCQKWDSNPRLEERLRPKRSALDRSAILTGEAWLRVRLTASTG